MIAEKANVNPGLRYDDKVFVVTGAGRGLGAAYARLLAARGGTVVVNDLGTSMIGEGPVESVAEALVSEIRAHGGCAMASRADISDQRAVEAMIDDVVDRYGRLDGLINNAGTISVESFETVKTEVLQRQLDVHLFGSLFVTKAAWPHLVASSGAAVFSTSGAMFGTDRFVSYSVAKAAVYGLMRSVAVAGSTAGVRVNGVVPAAETRMQATAVDAQTSPERRSTAPVHSPDNAAPLTCFLVHPSCPAHGELFATGRGLVSRIVLGSGAGLVSSEFSLETVAENFATVMDIGDLTVVKDIESYRDMLHGRAAEIVEAQAGS